MAERWEEAEAEARVYLGGQMSASRLQMAWIDMYPQQAVAGGGEAGGEARGVRARSVGRGAQFEDVVREAGLRRGREDRRW